MKAFISGIDGFTGRYLALELKTRGYTVCGVSHREPVVPLEFVDDFAICDLANKQALGAALARTNPDVVAHLAALAFVGHGDPSAFYQVNVMGTRNLLEALASLPNAPRCVLIASSANIYGNATEGILDEACPPAPANDYAVSKLAMEYVAKLYSARLPIVLARPFNYTGIGQDESFLLPKIIESVRRRAPVIELGNLHVSRDFSDVRMVVDRYRRILETPAAVGHTFNVCSGIAYSLDDVLSMIRKITGASFEIRVNPAFVRPNEVKVLLGTCAKLDALVGASEPIALIETLRWMLAAPAAS